MCSLSGLLYSRCYCTYLFCFIVVSNVHSHKVYVIITENMWPKIKDGKSDCLLFCYHILFCFFACMLEVQYTYTMFTFSKSGLDSAISSVSWLAFELAGSILGSGTFFH